MRWRWRWSMLVMLVVSVVCGLWVWQAPAKAATLIGGQGEFEVPADQTLDDDVYVVGGSGTIAGHVLRNVFVIAGVVRVTGAVDGDVTALGETVEISGPVRGTVRAVGGTVRVNSPVGWDVLAAGGKVTLGPNAVVDHEVRIGGNTGVVQGRVNGDLYAGTSQLMLQGQVAGSVHATVETLTVGSGGIIEGNLDYRAPQQATIADGAQVRGATHYTATAPQPAPRSFSERLLAWLNHLGLRLAWALIAGTLFVLLLPQRAARISATLVRAPLPSVLWGVLALLVGPIVAILLAITVVGLPAAFLVVVVYLSVLYLSQVIVGLGLVRSLLPGRWRTIRRGPLWIAMLIGTVVLMLVRLLPLPSPLGFWWTLGLSLIVGVLGLGAFWTDVTGWGLAQPASVVAPEPAATEPIVIRTLEPTPESSVEPEASPPDRPSTAETSAEPSPQPDDPRRSTES